MAHPVHCYRSRLRLILTCSILAVSAGGLAMAADLSTLTRLAANSTVQQASAQEKIDQLDEAAQDAYADYRAKLIELESLRTYTRQLQALLDKQQALLDNLDAQIQKTGSMDRELIPLMERMYDALGTLIEQDMPFLATEREDRRERLRGILDNPELSLATKYRSLYEAYQIELDYGRTLETYSDTLEVDGKSLMVTILRVGRVALYAMSADRNIIYEWNNESREWQPTDGLRHGIEKAVRMAKKQVAPDLLVLSVPAPEDAP
ncbi:MAG: DUF3450 domain-containing protein [Gammaproteobacteria bacterium]|nr:DUF3450 domain-containing protein [Gammaproteobacteria bacterium]MDE0302293.1 DUF3450 domain-containing protein [Gammaproteobacteria bacterium]